MPSGKIGHYRFESLTFVSLLHFNTFYFSLLLKSKLYCNKIENISVKNNVVQFLLKDSIGIT